MWRLFLCIPIFRGFLLLKKVKRMCICDYYKNRIVTCESFFFVLNEGISEKVCQVALKHTAGLMN